MTAHNYSNVAGRATLTGSLTTTATSIAVDTVSGYPVAPFWVMIDRDLATMEIVEVTAQAGNTWTVVRAQGDTVASPHSAGAIAEHVAPAKVFQDSEAHIEATTNVHGVSGSLVGLAGEQSLQDKFYRGAHQYRYSDLLPSTPLAGFEALADNNNAKDSFVSRNTGADDDQRAFLNEQAGVARTEIFHDGTVKINPPVGTSRPALEVVGKIQTQTLAVSGTFTAGTFEAGGTVVGNQQVTGNLTVDGTSLQKGNVTLGDSISDSVTIAGTLSVAGQSTVVGVDASGTINANSRLRLPDSGTTGTAARQIRVGADFLPEIYDGTNFVRHFSTGRLHNFRALSVSVPDNIITTITGLGAVSGNPSPPICSMTSGNLTLSRAGVWALKFLAGSDSTFSGWSRIFIDWPSAPFNQSVSSIADRQYRGSGFGGAGTLEQEVSWTGYVNATQAASQIGFKVWQGLSTPGSVTYNFYVIAEFIGA